VSPGGLADGLEAVVEFVVLPLLEIEAVRRENSPNRSGGTPAVSG
jgi:hypothetical protein